MRALELRTEEEIFRFVEETYGAFARTVPGAERSAMMNIGSHTPMLNDLYDADTIAAFNKNFYICPTVPFDIVVYRGGKMNDPRKPYLSASFLKEKAEEFGPVHKIVVKKESVIFPSPSMLWEDPSGYRLGEAEVILEQCRLKKIILRDDYLYK